LEWIACSCLECRGLECLGEVNGGGWGCIYSHQPLPSRCSNSADHEQSAPLVRTVRPCTSTAEIATISSNGYINGYNALNASSDKGSRGWSGRAPRTVREDAKNHFTEPVTFGFFGSSPTGRSAPEPGRSARGLGRCLLSLRTVRSVDLDFLHWFCPRVTLVSRTVRA
jgi:hypothetical protein